MEKDNRANRYSPETRERAVPMVLDNQGNYESQSAAIKAIAPKIGCGRDTLRRWVQQEKADTGNHMIFEERVPLKGLDLRPRHSELMRLVHRRLRRAFVRSRSMRPPATKFTK